MPAVEVHGVVEEELKGDVGDLTTGGGGCNGVSHQDGLDHENGKDMYGSFVLIMEKDAVGDYPVETDCNGRFVSVESETTGVELKFENGDKDDPNVKGDIDLGSSSHNEGLGQKEENQGGFEDSEKQNGTANGEKDDCNVQGDIDIGSSSNNEELGQKEADQEELGGESEKHNGTVNGEKDDCNVKGDIDIGSSYNNEGLGQKMANQGELGEYEDSENQNETVNGQKDDCNVKGDTDIGPSSNNDGLGQQEANQGELGANEESEKQIGTIAIVEPELEAEVQELKDGEVPRSKVIVLEATEYEGKLAEPNFGKIGDNSKSDSDNVHLEELHESKITRASTEFEQHEVDTGKDRELVAKLDLTGLKEEEGQESEVSTICGLELESESDNFEPEENQDAQITIKSSAEAGPIENEETNFNPSEQVGQQEDTVDPQIMLQNNMQSGDEENNSCETSHLEVIQELQLPQLVDVQEICVEKSDGIVQVEDNEDSKRKCIMSTESESQQRDFGIVEEGKSDSSGREHDQDPEIVSRDDLQIEGVHNNDEASGYEVSLEESLGNLGMNLKQNPELKPCPSADMATEVVNDMVYIESVDVLPPGQIQDVDVGDSNKSEMALSVGNCQILHSENGGSMTNVYAESILFAHTPDLRDIPNEMKLDESSENAKNTPAHVNCEDVFITNSDPSLTTDNEKMVKPDYNGVAASTANISIMSDESLVVENGTDTTRDVPEPCSDAQISELETFSSNHVNKDSGGQVISDDVSSAGETCLIVQDDKLGEPYVTVSKSSEILLIGAVPLDMSPKAELEKLDLKSSKEFSSIDEAVIVEDDTHPVIDDTKSISAVTLSELENNCDHQEISDVCLSPKERSSPNDIVSISIVDVENGGYKPVGQETKGANLVPKNEMLSSLEVSTVVCMDGQNVGCDVEKIPLPLLIKHPRYDDVENLTEQIKHAQLVLEEKTKKRDAIAAELRKERAIDREYYSDIEAARSNERASNDMLRSKRQEVDAAQFLINKVKDAMDVGEIDSRLWNLQHRIEHETVPLKEEKQLIREIKQLKQQREQISSSMGPHDELQQLLDQKEETKDRLKYLKKELDLIRGDHLKADSVVKAARKKQSHNLEKQKNLKIEFNAADEIQHNAYTHLQSLKKALKEKTKYYWKYRDDRRLADEYKFKGDKDALQRHCVNQVEEFMDLWNKNEEFRKEYVRLNTNSTLRRLKTLDGRSLGPNEEPPVISNAISARVVKENGALVAQKQEKPVALKKPGISVESAARAVELKNQTAKTSNSSKTFTLNNVSATVSGRNEVEDAREEKNKLTEEEVEMSRKAEELRKKEEAEKLKAQLRLEEKAKAEAAQERKKRNAEKVQARATLRAQKEAEEKEKEREKRAKKKERKKMAGEEATRGSNETESAPSTETLESPEVREIREKPLTATKRVQKPSQFTKQIKAKSIPPPLRKRGKRRMHQWMWFLLAILLVGLLFLVGKFAF